MFTVSRRLDPFGSPHAALRPPRAVSISVMTSWLASQQLRVPWWECIKRWEEAPVWPHFQQLLCLSFSLSLSFPRSGHRARVQPVFWKLHFSAEETHEVSRCFSLGEVCNGAQGLTCTASLQLTVSWHLFPHTGRWQLHIRDCCAFWLQIDEDDSGACTLLLSQSNPEAQKVPVSQSTPLNSLAEWVCLGGTDLMCRRRLRGYIMSLGSISLCLWGAIIYVQCCFGVLSRYAQSLWRLEVWTGQDGVCWERYGSVQCFYVPCLALPRVNVMCLNVACARQCVWDATWWSWHLLFCSRETPTMVQLFPSQAPDATALLLDDSDGGLDSGPNADSPHAFTDLQLALNPSATLYHGYENYIEDGLLSLRHKIRNLEKKKVTLSLYIVNYI